MNPPSGTIKKGTDLELKIDELAFGGEGVARTDDFVVFVEGALPGQRLVGKIVKKRKTYAAARILEVLEQSPLATSPKCQHFGQCGGCRLQHMRYPAQLQSKQKQVSDILQRIANMDAFQLEDSIASPDQYFYRNKMDFSFSRYRWLAPDEIKQNKKLDKQGLYLGLHARNVYDKLVDIQNCYLLDPRTGDILAAIRDFARCTASRKAYSTRDHCGFWRFLVLRQSKFSNGFMVNLITSEYDNEIAKAFKSMMQHHFPSITSLLFSTTRSKSSVSFSEKEFLLAGDKTIVECLGNFEYEISANSFFQTNSKQAKHLYDTVIDYAQLNGSETVWDLYCGAGTISLYTSPYVKQVIGFESVQEAIEDANRNKKRNGVSNCAFVNMDLKDLKHGLTDTIKTFGKPELLIIDPPRGGMHPKTVQAVLELDADRIVHISCNPASLARDLKILCEEKYSLRKIKAVDMFPHTAHIEVVAQLQKT